MEATGPPPWPVDKVFIDALVSLGRSSRGVCEITLPSQCSPYPGVLFLSHV